MTIMKPLPQPKQYWPTQPLDDDYSEGKYHQVKRMVAAAGNRVEQLHREEFGDWNVDDLAAGEWKFIQI